MRKFIYRILSILLVVQACLAQTPRFLDNYSHDGTTILLGICHPTQSALNSIIALKNEGFLPAEGLQIVGLYHKDESADYAGAQLWAESEGLAWIAYHELQGALPLEDLWKNNACTIEFSMIFNKLHGLILFGGADIPPAIYGDKTQLLTGIYTPVRHLFEASFIFNLLGGSQNTDHKPLLEKRPDFPVLGICLGEQTINVGTGGTLTQDIWFQKYKKTSYEDVIALGPERWHRNPWSKLHPRQGLTGYTMHHIKLNANGKFVKVMGFSKKDQPLIISSHHQMVNRLGRGIRIIATSLDGKVPEAIDHVKFKNVLGVQFHPELSKLYDPDFKTRTVPGEAMYSMRSKLENNPPSYQFHRSIWSWFVKNMETQRSQ
ncbi:gamma-glutamyl-gamma-aminobutyrate hydrolase family protein [bacterium]|nr:gamma-glutamyl-gamma-aminobutyrate hydrolase family protein [bacterium]